MTGLLLANHIHTEWSDDSEWSLPRLARLLRRVGFDGALVADHDRTMTEERRQQLVRACSVATSPGFVFVPGVEYQDPDHVVHMPVYGDVPFFGRSPDIGELLSYAAAHGGAAVVAHPARRDSYRRFQQSWVPNLSGIEVWNRKYDGVAPNSWALEVAQLHDLPMFVALDFHGPRQLFPMGMNVDVQDPMDPQEVVVALRSGKASASFVGLRLDALAKSRVSKAMGGLETVRRKAAPQARRIEKNLTRRGAG